MSTDYRPQTDDHIEILNWSLQLFLRVVIHEKQSPAKFFTLGRVALQQLSTVRQACFPSKHMVNTSHRSYLHIGIN